MKTTPKDFFINIGLMLALYISTISIISLLFLIIDLSFVDNIYNTYRDPYSSGMRLAIASIIIFFPLYIFLGYINNKDTVVNPEKKDLPIRKWSVYFTLFVTSAVLLVDLVVVLNNFLGGEISIRFFLKALTVFVIAGLVFLYYIMYLKGLTQNKKVFNAIWISDAVFVVLILVLAFSIMGSPMKQRLLRFDMQKVQDLERIEIYIENYWERLGVLPVSLSEVNIYDLPKDPQNNQGYGYKMIDKNTFELCAEFNLKNEIKENTKWNHNSGNVCFTRKVLPKLSPGINIKNLSF